MFTLPRDFTSAKPRRWRRVPGLVLAEVDYAPGAVDELHPHARFVLVVGGSLGPDRSRQAPVLWFFAPQQSQVFQVPSGGARCLIVDMDDGWIARVREAGPLFSHSTSFRAGRLTHLARRLHDEFLRRDEVSRLAIESLALGVVAEASRHVRHAAEPRPPAWLEHARAFVDQHFAERLPLSAVAAVAGVHPVHLARTFRRAYDTTFSDYLRGIRLDFARQQLATTAASLGDIAAAAGYYDQSHFCRLFKQATGVSPAAYRDSIKAR